MADYPISNVPRRVQYVNSGVGPYAFTFEILVQTDIAVYRGNTLLTLTTDYTVAINANGTGSITLVVAGTGNITIVGARAIQRSSDYTTGGDLFASTLNTDLDSQTIYSQQLAETLDRTIKVPVTDASTLDMQLPISSTRANKVFAFDASGIPQVSVNTLAAIDAAVDTIESIAGAPSGNSAGISHIASGTGAVATTVQTKLRETVSVKDFGAVGNGVADDTVAIQAALDSGAKYIVFPPNTYIGKITNIPSNVTITGYGAVLKLPASQPALTPVIAIQDSNNVGIFGLTIDGNKAQNSQTGSQDGGLHGIRLYSADRVYISDAQIFNCDADGVYVSGTTSLATPSSNIVLNSIKFDNNSRNAISIITVKRLIINNCEILNTAGKLPEAGIDIEQNVSTQVVEDVTIQNCNFSGNQGRGFVCDTGGPTKGIQILNSSFTNNSVDDVVFTGSTGSVVEGATVMNCQISSAVRIQANTGNTMEYSSINILNNVIDGNIILRDFAGGSGVIIQDNLIAKGVDAARAATIDICKNKLIDSSGVSSDIAIATTCSAVNIFENYVEGLISALMSSGSVSSNNVFPKSGFDGISTLDIVAGKIIGNTVVGGRDSIAVRGSGSVDCNVANNSVSDSSRHGITVVGSRAVITGNGVKNHVSNGFEFANLLDSVALGNTATGCNIGMRFASTTSDNAICANVLKGNTTNLSIAGSGNVSTGNIAP
jgi:hypothetical protein